MNIDILIPVASQSKFIRDAVYSAIQQTVTKKIFIIENNIGSEEYSSYLKELAAEFSVEYYFFELRLPIFENWDRCLSVGTSEWIAFLHDDDIWSPNYLEMASKVKRTSDIIFYEWTNFRGVPLANNLHCKLNVTTLTPREKLLARTMDSYHHASSTLFKRTLNLHFPVGNFKFVGDQYGFRECIAIHQHIRVSWVDTGSPNLIRLHPDQETSKVGLLYAGIENALSYTRMVMLINSQSINTKDFCAELIECYSDVFLSRILSAILFRKPYILTTAIVARSLTGRGSIPLILITLARAVSQRLVWFSKLFVAANRSRL